MRLEGPKGLVKRAAYAARLLDVSDFSLDIAYGDSNYCERAEDGSFVICVADDTPKPLLMEVIAHEMVHLRQYKHDRLRDDGIVVFWDGKPYLEPETLSDDYWLAPWELEARSLQEWIAYRWENRKHELH